MSAPLEAKYGLPREVVFCKRCVMSNQRPSSTTEFKHTAQSRKATLHLDAEGVCDACRYAERKETIDWESREQELQRLLDRFRRHDGQYDCLVPGSGGKDSCYAAWLLKYKYGMHPLTVTWPPMLYTDYGYRNFMNWIEVGGFDNITWKPNGRVMKLLTRLSIENLFHPFQTFILGQKNIAPKIAANFGIPLVFYGENEAEYGNPVAQNANSRRDKSYFMAENLKDTYLAGVSIDNLIKEHGLSLADLKCFLPLEENAHAPMDIEVRYLGYYIKWVPQESYYNAVEHCQFEARPFRTQGTYSKYNSIDDKIDDLHYYTTYIKFGLGRATYDAAQEIRNKHLTRDEGVALVKRFDGEFPDRYFNEIMDYLEMRPERFMELADQARSPHLWRKVDGVWKLRHTVFGEGVDD